MELMSSIAAVALVTASLLIEPPTETPAVVPSSSAPVAKEPAVKAPPTAIVPTKDDIVDTASQKDLPTQRVTIFGEQFDAELCLTEESRSLGMGGRSEFPATTGAGATMIFVHPRPLMLSYWMRNCFIGLDIIFLDGQGRITAMHEAPAEKLRTKTETNDHYEARLYRYSSKRPAQFVIELPLGSIARLKPKLGQQVNIDWQKLVLRAR